MNRYIATALLATLPVGGGACAFDQEPPVAAVQSDSTDGLDSLAETSLDCNQRDAATLSGFGGVALFIDGGAQPEDIGDRVYLRDIELCGQYCIVADRVEPVHDITVTGEPTKYSQTDDHFEGSSLGEAVVVPVIGYPYNEFVFAADAGLEPSTHTDGGVPFWSEQRSTHLGTCDEVNKALVIGVEPAGSEDSIDKSPDYDTNEIPTTTLPKDDPLHTESPAVVEDSIHTEEGI